MSDYDKQFFAYIRAGSRASAAVILPLVIGALHPRSVVDVGCGTGEWLNYFHQAGIDEYVGLDGSYIDRDQLAIPADRFQEADLTLPLSLDRTFDLAVSLEVAEHLPPERGVSFVAELTELAPAVLFSAAVPGQTGVDHINERWQSEWAATFAERGYRPVDLIRPQVWSDPAVEFWYAQNTMLYVAASIELSIPSSMPLDVVHPRLLEQTTRTVDKAYDRVRTAREILPELPGATLRAVRHRLNR
jgi:SAM-dependent methyltransferase